MKIQRLYIRNYRGIEEREVDVPPGGLVIKGGNYRGKTSMLNAIRTALAGGDTSPDAIRHGADRAEIFVAMDEITVRRTIRQTGADLKVTGPDGAEMKKPQTVLNELLGNAPFDPLDLYHAKPKERRAIVLSAVPCAVTADDVERWTGDRNAAPQGAEHGLAFVERLTAAWYEKRRIANALAEDTERKAATARVAVPTEASEQVALTEAEAGAQLDEAIAARARLEERMDAAKRTAVQRQELQKIVDAAASPTAYEQRLGLVSLARAQIEESEGEVARLEELLHDARRTLEGRLLHLHEHEGKLAEIKASADRADSARKALAALTDTDAPTADQIAEARAAEDRARDVIAAAKAWEERTRALADAKTLEGTAKSARDEADRLDRIVKRLQNDAPVDLLSRSGGIRGLSVRGDDVLLDGVSLDGLSGAERVWFCVQVARRLNEKSKILIVDELEALDPDELEAFVKYATEDGWQLLCTRVERGEVCFEPVESPAEVATCKGESK